MTELLATTANVSGGYTVKAVAARIADMDIDADGNAEKAAWKRYLSLCLLALAKAVDKSVIVEMVFGNGGKASKTFHNMWTLANKCRNTVTGNITWPDIAAMGVQEAFDATIAMINRHMAVHNVNGKNAYDAVCNMTVEEVAAKAKAEADAKADADAEAAAKAEADAEAASKAEAEAKQAASEQAERTPAEAAIGALHGASREDVLSVMAYCVNQLSNADLIMVRDQLEMIVANAAKATAASETETVEPKGRKVAKAA